MMNLQKAILTTAFLLVHQLDLTLAADGPFFGFFCPSIIDGWLCNADLTTYWLTDSCGIENSTVARQENLQIVVLVDFYFSTGNALESGPLYDIGWTSNCDYCTWKGVGCDEDGTVVAIKVGGLSEPLTGEIPTVLANLTSLESLELHDNEFEGNIPSELGLLTSLTNLKLHYNDLRGRMPDEVCDLGGYNGAGIRISADCGSRFPWPQVRCERRTCCDACYIDRLRNAVP